MIGNFYPWWFYFCFSITLHPPYFFFFNRTSTIALPGVWNATYVPKSSWGLNDSNFTSSERPSQTNQSKETMPHISQSILSRSSLLLRALNAYQKAVCMCIGSLVLCLSRMCALWEQGFGLSWCLLYRQHPALFLVQ